MKQLPIRDPAEPSRTPVLAAKTPPSIGLALGGGGARGLAHIVMLEVFDEMGITPKIIAGTSIGAIIGSAYASGIPAAALRKHAETVLSQRLGTLRDVFARGSQPFRRLRSLFGASNAILDADALLELVMPDGLAADFNDLKIPLKIVASDFYDQEPYVFTEGPVRTAVAASMALPVIFQPVVVDGRALIDGGLTNPLPFDVLFGEADIVVAIDVSGAPVPDPGRPYPGAIEALFASAFLFERSIVREKLKSAQPDILVAGGTSQYQVLDLLKWREIFASSETAKAKLKAQLARVLSVETLPQIEAAEPAQPRLRKRQRGIFERRRKAGDGGSNSGGGAST